LRWIVLALVVTVSVYALWISRNTYVPESFVPADQRLQIVVVDPLVKREALAASPVWEAMPAFTGLQQVPTMLRGVSDAPEWVLNNLIGEVCHVSAHDTQTFSDLLFVTTMTRVGVWIERCYSLRGNVEHDEAGGLELRKLPGQELHYAVRGRTLVASRSRDALIRALTLRPSESVAPESITGEIRPKGSEDLSGTILLTEEDPLGSAFASMSFAVLVKDTTLRVLFRGVPTPFWQQQLAASPNLGPRSLPVPPEGMVTASLNLGLPIRDTWALLGATGVPAFSAEQWENWSTLTGEEAPGVAYFLTTLTGSLGPGVGISLSRVDVNAMFPMPEVAAVLEASAADIEAAYAALPRAPEGSPLAGYPSLNADTKLVSYPMPAGPELEPTAAPYGPGLLVSNSRTLAEELLATGPPAKAEGVQGNVFVRVLPAQCVTAAIEVGRLLAEDDLLKGYDAASFEDAATEWLATASGVREATLVASYVDGEISGEVRVETMAP
jgi:hypothetical protein